MKKFLTEKWRNFQKNNKSALLFIILILLSQFVYSQKVVKVSGVKGISYITENNSIKDAKVEALNDAKLKAIKKAGGAEYFNSYEVSVSSQIDKEFSQFYNSGIASDLRGAVLDVEVEKDYQIFKKNEFEFFVEIIISANVIIYENGPDDLFNVEINGIKSVYNENDKLIFSITATKDCYLKIFSWDDAGIELIYPNQYQPLIKLTKNKIQNFGDKEGGISYYLTTSDKKINKNKWIFVFTKEDYPIKIKDGCLLTIEDVFYWINNIMPDKKRVEYRMSIIQK